MSRFARLLRSTGGASAAEFAIVLPILLLLLFGIFDVGRFMWEYNNAEKATQMGARYAVVTDLVLGQSFADYSFAVEDGILAGSPVPAANFGSAVCTQSGCTCSGSACGAVAYDGTAFAAIVNHMNDHYAPIASENVEIEYRNIGLGYAGDPNGPDVAPLVTVRLTDLQFTPVTFMVFGASFNMPDFSAALTLEDGDGNVSN